MTGVFSQRLAVGLPLAGLAVLALLVADSWLAPVFPFLMATLVGLAVLSVRELRRLLPRERRPRPWLTYPVVPALLLLNWVDPAAPLHGFALLTVAAFLWEMTTYEQPGEAVNRVALTVWVAAYLGLLPGYLAQLRLSPVSGTGSWELALALAVPKMCDVGAYFTGHAVGRHRMSPVLSPKKTWEGAAGGLVAAVATAAAVQLLRETIPGGWPGVVGFGVVVGVAAMFGDLAESLVKRDISRKDASDLVPGFGGVLDVLDSILFAGPAAWAWFHFIPKAFP